MTEDDLVAVLRRSGLPDAALALVDVGSMTTLRVGTATEHYPASMIKVPLAVAAYAAAKVGAIDLDRPAPVAVANATFNDAPSPVVPGAMLNARDLVRYAVDRSDNIATNELFDRLGRDAATATLTALGYPRTAFRRKLSGADPLIDDPAATGRNAHPIEEAARLFAAIARGTVPGAVPIRAALAAQQWNTKLSAGLSPGDVFHHKTGDTDATSHDGGILTLAEAPDAPWVVVVYANTRSSDDADDPRFAAVMRALRPYLASAQGRRYVGG
jgi:beta-lactamase class A